MTYSKFYENVWVRIFWPLFIVLPIIYFDDVVLSFLDEHTIDITLFALSIDVFIGMYIGWVIFHKGEKDKTDRLKLESDEIDKIIMPIITELRRYNDVVRQRHIQSNIHNDIVKKLRNNMKEINEGIEKKINYSRDVFEPDHIKMFSTLLEKTTLIVAHLPKQRCVDSYQNMEWHEYNSILDSHYDDIDNLIHKIINNLVKRYKYKNI